MTRHFGAHEVCRHIDEHAAIDDKVRNFLGSCIGHDGGLPPVIADSNARGVTFFVSHDGARSTNLFTKVLLYRILQASRERVPRLCRPCIDRDDWKVVFLTCLEVQPILVKGPKA